LVELKNSWEKDNAFVWRVEVIFTAMMEVALMHRIYNFTAMMEVALMPRIYNLV
jgi:hypothetical protein